MLLRNMRNGGLLCYLPCYSPSHFPFLVVQKAQRLSRHRQVVTIRSMVLNAIGKLLTLTFAIVAGLDIQLWDVLAWEITKSSKKHV